MNHRAANWGDGMQPTRLNHCERARWPILCSVVVFCWGIGVERARAANEVGSIKNLSQHFNEPGGDFSPWMFVPDENVKEISTREHPGLVAVWEAGKGKDLKGILKEPIRVDDYRLPWEFQLALVQNFNAMLANRAVDQMNYAIGLNVAVTFSDPSQWPEDRTQRPPRTRDFQLLVVHLGATGEAGAGLPQFSDMPTPDKYFVWGRGDLGYATMGNWNIPSIWVGDGGRRGGPANDRIFFRFRMLSPTYLQFGFRGDQSYAFHIRSLDVSQYGAITGIWEIGPIISCDRWIPDVLCRNLTPIKGWSDPGDLVSEVKPGGRYSYRWEKFYKAPDPVAPKPTFAYYVDYCAFFPSAPLPLEEYSDNFDIVGYMAKWQAQPQSTLIDTHTNPGYLTMTLIGSSCATGFGPLGGSELELSRYPPPWEIEIAFIAPDDTIPWNFWMNWQVADQHGNWKTTWQPGVQNFPEVGKHRYIDRVQPSYDKVHDHSINIVFDQEPPESILSAKPLTMLIQIVDPSHVRIGFRARKGDPWYLSQPCDVTDALDGPIGKLGQHAWGTVTGRAFGAPPGSPMFQKFLIDSIEYRYGLSTE